jgi:hypothetical protein
LIEELLNPFEAAFTKLMKNFVDQLGGLFSGKGFDIGGLLGGTGGNTGTGGVGGKVGLGALGGLGGLTSLVGGGMLALFTLTQGPVITRAIDALMAEVAKQSTSGTTPGSTTAPGAGSGLDDIAEQIGRATGSMTEFSRSVTYNGNVIDGWGRTISDSTARIESATDSARRSISDLGTETTRTFRGAATEIIRATSTMEGFSRAVGIGLGMIYGSESGAASFGAGPNDRSGTNRLSVAVDPFTHENLADVIAGSFSQPTINININAIDAQGVREVTQNQVIPAIVDALQTNRGGARTNIRNAITRP